MNQRGLSPDIVRYAFSDVFDRIDGPTKKALVSSIHAQRSILGARRLRRSINRHYRSLSKEISKYLGRKYSDNINITMLLLLTEPRIVSGAGAYLDDLHDGYSTEQISRIFNLDPSAVSKRLYDFERSVKGNILLETEAGQCLRLSVVTDGGSKKRFSIHLETASSLRAARVKKVLILCSEPHQGVQRFMDSDQAFRVHDMLENWSPEVALAKSESQTLLDVFAITDDGIWQSRYYHDADHTALIFERETLSLPRLSG